MSSTALFIAWFSAFILAICFLSLSIEYKKHLNVLAALKEKVKQAEIDLRADLSSVDKNELNQTSAGKELLSQVYRFHVEPVQELDPQNINTRLGLNFFTLATCITSVIAAINSYLQLYNSTGGISAQHLLGLIVAAFFLGASVYVLRVTRFYLGWKNVGTIDRLLAYVTMAAGVLVIFPVILLLLVVYNVLAQSRQST